MSAGLPGFGLGGVFYMLLIVWMVLRAFSQKGKAHETCSSRWLFIGKMVAMGIVMVGVFLGQSVLIVPRSRARWSPRWQTQPCLRVRSCF